MKNSQKGVSLFLALIVMSLLFSVTLGVSSILISQARVLKIMQGSVAAFYAAETGIEQMLYLDKICWDGSEAKDCPSFCPIYMDDPCPGLVDGYTLPNADFPAVVLDSGVSYKAVFSIVGGDYIVESIGVYKDVTRAIEVTM